MDGKTITRARVAVVIEFDVGDSWGGDCQLLQVHKQASEKALAILGSLTDPSRTKHYDGTLHNLKVIGHPEVNAITTKI